MPDVYDAIVLGVGGFGSSAMFHLALRGLNVLGIDRFSIAHDRGSSHGETRIIRKAYFEHSDYVPLLLRAYDLWAELEATSQRQLFWPCGLMLAGLPESEAIAGARLSARTHGLNIENLSPDAAQKRWPGFRIPETFDVVFEPEAGFLGVEECVRAHVELAASHGANLLLDEPVVGWSSDGSEVRVRTANRELVAKSLVITAGAWASSVLSDLEVPLQILRKPLFWYETTASDYTLTSEMPTFYFDAEWLGLPRGRLLRFSIARRPFVENGRAHGRRHCERPAVREPRGPRIRLVAHDRILANLSAKCRPQRRAEFRLPVHNHARPALHR